MTYKIKHLIDPVILDLNRYLSAQEEKEMEEEMLDSIASDILDGGYIDTLGNSWDFDSIDMGDICTVLAKDPQSAQDMLFKAVGKLASEAFDFEKDLYFEG